MRPQSRNEFETAIICALPLEFDAIEAVLDEYYDGLGSIGDANWYRAGRVGQHNIVNQSNYPINIVPPYS
jgi:hypothetical protein